jgi:hypothetical protein
VVIDMLEAGLDEPTQRALIAYLRDAPRDRPLFFLTRSCATILPQTGEVPNFVNA